MSDPLYGIWMRGRGWLRVAGKDAVAFSLRSLAVDCARRVGGEVRYIDDSLAAPEIEGRILERERQPFWARK